MSFSKDSHHSGLKRAYNVLKKEFYIAKKKKKKNPWFPLTLVPEMPQSVEDIY